MNFVAWQNTQDSFLSGKGKPPYLQTPWDTRAGADDQHTRMEAWRSQTYPGKKFIGLN